MKAKALLTLIDGTLMILRTVTFLSPMVYTFALWQWTYERAAGFTETAGNKAFDALIHSMFSDWIAIAWLLLVIIHEFFVSARENGLFGSDNDR